MNHEVSHQGPGLWLVAPRLLLDPNRDPMLYWIDLSQPYSENPIPSVPAVPDHQPKPIRSQTNATSRTAAHKKR